MKNLLLFGLAITVLIALFGDGGLEVSPTVSPALKFSPNLEFKPNVSYAPDRSVNTTNIETNIEHQTVIVQAPAANGMGAVDGHGVTLLDPSAPGATNLDCFGLYPGERVYNGPDAQGACFVQNEQGQKFFVNRSGVRWLLNGTVEQANGLTPLAPAPTPLSPADGGPTLDQMRAAFLRNGGELPFGWSWWAPYSQERWLKEQAATWK